MLNKNISVMIINIVLIITLIGCASIEENPQFDQNNIKAEKEQTNLDSINPVYVFADSNGNNLITFIDNKELENLSNYTHALSSKGLSKVVYRGYQKKSSDYNERETMYEFKKMPGHIFEISDTVVDPNETCLLVNQATADSIEVIDFEGNGLSDLDSTLANEIETIKKREIAEGWIIAHGDTWEIGVVQFERVNDNMLASVFLREKGEISFSDYYEENDEISTWRVEDYAQIDPYMFRVNFIVQESEEIAFSISWFSYEVESVMFLLKIDDRLIEINGSGRYILPL